MKLPIRLENAITKLYTAFHEGHLNAYKCEACAVGNILGTGYWQGGFNTSLYDNDQKIRPVSCDENKSGYNGNELFNVEKIFIISHQNTDISIKEKQFKGLCSVVEYLCELDNITNVMDYTKLFETENNEPKYRLTNS